MKIPEWKLRILEDKERRVNFEKRCLWVEVCPEDMEGLKISYDEYRAHQYVCPKCKKTYPL